MLDLLGLSREVDEVGVLHREDGVDTSNVIGFSSNIGHKPSRDERWEVMYERLKVYKEKHGHCRVSNSDGNNEQQLVLWVGTQRRTRQLNHRPDRMAKLDLLGFFGNNKANLDALLPCGGEARNAQRGAEHLQAEVEQDVVTVEVEDENVSAAPVEHSTREKDNQNDFREQANNCSRRQDGCA